MARLEEKIAEISDPALRQSIAEEVAKLKKNTRFGLVFEEHQPEVVPVYGRRIKRGERVGKKVGNLTEIWRVMSVKDGKAHCELEKGGSLPAGMRETFPIEQLVAIRSMGEPIYPSLTPVDSVRNCDPSAPHHVLIEADNYHALQLLLFPYEGKVDCIFIDPPYNTGARDWKYNNDYVDGNDGWRHSKWLSMMQRRLQLAKRLLNPADSVLIVTIDEKEFLRLGLLLEQEFPEANVTMVSSVINPAGAGREADFSRTDEYIFFVRIGIARVAPESRMQGETQVVWDTLRRSSLAGARGNKGPGACGPNQFFPIYVDEATGFISGIGEPLAEDVFVRNAPSVPGCITVLPIRPDGTEMNWGITPGVAKRLLRDGYLRAGKAKPKEHQKYVISYLTAGIVDDIQAGVAKVRGKNQDGTVDAFYPAGRDKMPTTNWNRPSHDAQQYGTKLLNAFLNGRQFPYPKSLYAVEDVLRFFVGQKNDAIVVDFFAGSGTTAHAVMRLNKQDGGRRRAICVTNNEVAAKEQVALTEQGLQPGQPDWEKWGICNHITFPRIAAAITGKTPDGEPIKGYYKFTDEFPMADGFAANLEYFRLDFLDPQEIQMGRQFAAILPILWMMAGSRGPRPAAPDAHAPWLLPDGCPFVVLMQETRFKEFVRHVESRTDVTHVFIVTNSLDSVHKLRHEWPKLHVVQLYKDYLENFRINLSEKPAL